MARSIVSSGTDASRAFWNIVRSVGFISGSPPPFLAATSTWRINFAKSFPRLASAAPFLCLIVAHFECPDIVLLFVVVPCAGGRLRDPGRVHGGGHRPPVLDGRSTP